MVPARRLVTSVTLAAAVLLAACQGPGQPKPTPATGGAKPKVGARVGAVRTLGEQDVLVAARLIGKVKLISDRGAGIISNNAGAVVSNNGGQLISDKGLGLVSDAGSGLIGKVKYGLTQASDGGLREALLADAEVEVLDGAGQPLADAKGPIRFKTDAQGAYRFEGKLPAENLVLRVKVAKAGALAGGELRALVPNPGGAEVAGELDVDTPATLGATYVLDRFVKADAAVYAKLPAREVDGLKRAMGAALRAEASAPSYDGEAIVGAVDALKAKAPPVKQALDRIESILLLGQKGLGAGKKATEVPITMPVAVAADPNGDLLVGEGFIGRIRRVAADGTIGLFAGAAAESTLGYAVGGLIAMRRGPDGALYAIEESSHRVVRLVPGQAAQPVAGNGTGAHGAVGGAATDVPLFPVSLAWGPDGTLYVGEAAGVANGRPRVLTVDAQGRLGEVPTPEPAWATGSVVGLDVGPDGTIYAAVFDLVEDPATRQRVPDGKIVRRKPGGAWEFVHGKLAFGEYADLALTPAGLLLAEDDGHRLWRLDPATLEMTPFAGTGRSGFAGDGGPAGQAQLSQPTGLFQAADGRVLFADRGNALVRAIAPDGTISTVAGLRGLFRQGAGEALAVNNPFGLALDAEGRLLIAEGAGHVVRRFDGATLEAVVGGERGFAGDGGPAAGARLNAPFSIASRDGVLYIGDTGNERVRRVAADGTIATVVGVDPLTAGKRLPDAALLPPAISLEHPTGLAIGPDGLLAFADQGRHQVFKLRADGQVQLLAGPPLVGDAKLSGDAGDGGPAAHAKFSGPVGLAYDAAGNLYVADLGNCRVRRITPDGMIDTYAGSGLAGLLAGPEAATATTAKEVAFPLPISLATDAQGNLYVGELGTRNFKAFGLDNSTTEIAKALPDLPARIKKIAPDGRVTIVAGPGGKVLTDPASDEALVVPFALLAKPDGTLVVADPGTNQVRLIPKEALQ